MAEKRPLQNVYTLVPRTYEYATLCDKKLVIQLGGGNGEIILDFLKGTYMQ